MWHGAPRTLLDRVRNDAVTVVTSPVLMAELDDVLRRRKFAAALQCAGTIRERVIAEMRVLADVVEPAPLPTPACRDPDDDHVIACALAAHADAIVSGDRDLLDLGQHQGIAILTAIQALARIG